MSQLGGFNADALLLGYSAGELTAEEQAALFQAAAVDQDLFDQLMDAEGIRNALTFSEQRQRAAEVVRAWELDRIDPEELERPTGGSAADQGVRPTSYAALDNRAPHR